MRMSIHMSIRMSVHMYLPSDRTGTGDPHTLCRILEPLALPSCPPERWPWLLHSRASTPRAINHVSGQSHRHCRRHVYCSDESVLKITVSTRAIQRCMAHAHRISIRMPAHMLVHMPIQMSTRMSSRAPVTSVPHGNARPCELQQQTLAV